MSEAMDGIGGAERKRPAEDDDEAGSAYDPKQVLAILDAGFAPMQRMVDAENAEARAKRQKADEDGEPDEYEESDEEDEDEEEGEETEEGSRVIGQRKGESFADFFWGDPNKAGDAQEEDVLLDVLKEKDATCVLIPVEGAMQVVHGPFKSRKQKYLDLAECRELLGCQHIDVVPCRVEVPEGKYEIILDDEAKLNGAKYNHAATCILGTQFGRAMTELRGGVLLCKAGALP